MIKKLAITFIVLLLALLIIIFKVNNIWSQPTEVLSDTFVIPKGKGLYWVAHKLEEKQVIPSATIFKIYIRFLNSKNNASSIKAGEFDLSESISQAELIEKLLKGDVISYQVTLIDGWSFKQFKQHLIKQEVLTSKITKMTDAQILQAVGAGEAHPEGLFAPETYFYQKGDSDLDILKRSYLRQQTALKEAWAGRQESQHIDTAYKVLILASIIEKETGKESERETISGVFHNRLNIGMKLQTDPTVIYGMGEKYKGNIRRKDLTTDTPHNTYTRYGLPPTPIAMPGKASILAAVNPKKTKALYFVGKGDGSHYFSKNLKEHNRAVAKYQLGK
jgi:UPF0755 protein